MIILVMGVSGSGKTTVGQLLAARLGYRFVEGDDFHPPANIRKMSRGEPLDDADRMPWLKRLHNECSQADSSGENLVLACSALRVRYRELLLADIDDSVLVYLEGTADTIAARLQRPGHFMPADLLASQLETLEPPTSEPHLCVNVDASVDATVDKILASIGVRVAGNED